MPIYEYRCRRCKRQMSLLLRSGETEPQRCPSCEGGRLERLISSFSVGGSGKSPDPRALRSSARDFLERPERYGEAMRALGERTGVSLDATRLDDAMHRLSEAKTSEASRDRSKGKSSRAGRPAKKRSES